MQTKPWYQSKLTWLGILMTLAGIIPVASALLSQATVSSADVVNAFGGVLVVVLRVWFTNTTIS